MSNRYIGAHVSAAGGPAAALIRAQSIGANCLQIFAGSPRSWARTLYGEKEVAKYKDQKLQTVEGPLYIHALYLINLATTDKANLQKSIDSLIFDLKNGDLIGCNGVVVHIGSHLGLGFDAIKSSLVEVIKQILGNTQNTPLLLENSANQKGKIGTLDDLEYLTKSIPDPRLGICVDTAHLYESGVDLKDKNQINNFVTDLEKRGLLGKLSLIHLNDSRTALGSTKDEHDNLGDGQIGENGLKNFINHPKLSHLPIILEVPGMDGNGPDKINIDRARGYTA